MKISIASSRVRPLPDLCKFCIIEQGQPRLRIYDMLASNYRKGFPIAAEAYPQYESSFEDVDYIPDHQLLVCATTDFSLQVFDARLLVPHRSHFQAIRSLAFERIKFLSHTAKESASSESGFDGLPLVSEAEETYLSTLANDALEAERMAYLRGNRAKVMADAGAWTDAPSISIGPSPIPRLKLIARIHVTRSQSLVRWLRGPQLLVTAGSTAALNVWEIRVRNGETSGEKKVQLVKDNVLHSSPGAGAPTDVLEVQTGTLGSRAGNAQKFSERGMFVTYGHSPVLHVWHYARNSIRLAGIRKEHLADIRCAATCEAERILLTGGVDNDIIGWDLASGEVAPMFRLPGHCNAPVVSLSSFPNASIAVSVDAAGYVRTWNISKNMFTGDDQ